MTAPDQLLKQQKSRLTDVIDEWCSFETDIIHIYENNWEGG